MRKKNLFLTVAILISSSVSFFSILINYHNLAEGYELVLLFPIVFSLMYVILIGKINFGRTSIPITLSIGIVIQWLRYVLTPFAISLSGNNVGTPLLSPEKSSIVLASIFMLLDLIVFFSLLYFYGVRSKVNKDKKILLRGNRIIYFFYLIFSLGIYFVFRKIPNLISFFSISSESGSRVGSNIVSTQITLVRQILIVAVILVFLFAVSYCSKKYALTKRTRYLYIAMIFSGINISIIIGESRTVQLYTSIVSIVILIHYFPEFKKKILLTVGSFGALLIGIMSVYKFFYVFRYGSYLAAIQNSQLNISMISQILQSYFLGPEGLAKAIEFSSIANLYPFHFIYDFLRSIVPISFFLNNDILLTSQQYNLFIYNGYQLTGHLLSSIAYGYLFFGIFGLSLFTILNIMISVYAEKKMYKSKSIEMMYVWGYVLARSGPNMIGATPSTLINASIILISAGLLFKIAIVMRFRMSNKI